MGGLAVCPVRAVVADLGVGHDYDLSGIGRIGEHFLVACEAGIKNDLSLAFGGRAKAPALEGSAVLQGKDRAIQYGVPPGKVVMTSLAYSIRRMLLLCHTEIPRRNRGH